MALELALANNTGGLAWLAPLSGAVTVVAVAMRRVWLTSGTTVAVAFSLVVSILAVDHQINPSASDRVGLLVLTVLVARLVAWPGVLPYVIGTGMAIAANTTRPHTEPPATVFVVTCLFVMALALGGYLRWLDLQRSQAAASARRDERLDLARELHDLVAHYVTGMVVQAQAGQLLAEQRPTVASEALARIEQAGTDALEVMRRMVGALRAGGSRPLTGPSAGLVGSAVLDDLVHQHNAAGVPACLRFDGIDPDALPPPVAAAIHRIVLESLTNVRRHAVDVTRVQVTVRRQADMVEVEVRDDGRDPGAHVLRRSEGFGVVGMTERARALGGTLIAGPAQDGPGWQVLAQLSVDGPGPRWTEADDHPSPTRR